MISVSLTLEDWTTVVYALHRDAKRERAVDEERGSPRASIEASYKQKREVQRIVELQLAAQTGEPLDLPGTFGRAAGEVYAQDLD